MGTSAGIYQPRNESGIFLISWGGRIYDRDTRSHPEPGKQQAYAAAIGLAVLCGALAPMLNYSVAFGNQSPIVRSLRKILRPFWLRNTAKGLAGGLLPNAAYSLYLLGTSIGWGLMQIFMIVAATASGIFSGEWNSASRSALLFLSSVLTALAFAIALVAKGSR